MVKNPLFLAFYSISDFLLKLAKKIAQYDCSNFLHTFPWVLPSGDKKPPHAEAIGVPPEDAVAVTGTDHVGHVIHVGCARGVGEGRVLVHNGNEAGEESAVEAFKERTVLTCQANT